MEEIVPAAEANRKFSRILQGVREGRTYVVTAHGKPIAKIVPVKKIDEVEVASKEVLMARLRSQSALDIGRWTRDELYEAEP